MRLAKTVRIVGTGMTPVGKLNLTATRLMQQALHKGLDMAGLTQEHLDGIVAIPSLSHPRFMEVKC